MSHGSLRYTASISANSEGTKTYTPPSGKTVSIYLFKAEIQFNEGMACLVWDKGGDDEELIWASTGASEMPFKYTLTGDGTKELSLVHTNGHSSSVIMASYIEYELT